MIDSFIFQLFKRIHVTLSFPRVTATTRGQRGDLHSSIEVGHLLTATTPWIPKQPSQATKAATVRAAELWISKRSVVLFFANFGVLLSQWKFIIKVSYFTDEWLSDRSCQCALVVWLSSKQQITTTLVCIRTNLSYSYVDSFCGMPF